MNKIKTLIVDDNQVLVDLLKDYLDSKEDFDVIATARNGLQGIEKLTQNLPDAVILDLVMPEYSGLYFLRELKKLDVQKPIIVIVSDYQNSGSFKVSVDLGADILLAKPFDYGDLCDSIRSYKKVERPKPKENKTDLLDLFNVRNIGTLLIKDAINLVEKDHKLMSDIHYVFELLANNYYHMNAKKVGDNIDKAILKAWNLHKKEMAELMNIQDNIKPNLRAIIEYYLKNGK